LRIVVCYTGGVGSQVLRLLLDHPSHEVVGVLVHYPDKDGRDIGELVGRAPVGVVATRDVGELVGLRADCALWHGATWERETVARFLRAGTNVYTGMAGFSVPLAYDEELLTACRDGQASLASGGNIPGLISDVLPLFLSGYSGNIRRIRATQRNHVADYPSAHQLQQFLTMGIPVREAKQANAVDAIWLTAQSDSAKLVAAGLGVSYGSTEISAKEYAVAPADIELAASGLKVAAGTVAGVRWTFTTTTADGAPFLDVVNEQTVALGLATDWRQLREEPNWTVEVDGQPSIICRLGLTEGIDQAGDASTALNAARAVNFIPQLVAAPPGWVSVLTVPAPCGRLATPKGLRSVPA
jgi:2,4-diaminopentanoate dehydrogenase